MVVNTLTPIQTAPRSTVTTAQKASSDTRPTLVRSSEDQAKHDKVRDNLSGVPEALKQLKTGEIPVDFEIKNGKKVPKTTINWDDVTDVKIEKAAAKLFGLANHNFITIELTLKDGKTHTLRLDAMPHNGETNKDGNFKLADSSTEGAELDFFLTKYDPKDADTGLSKGRKPLQTLFSGDAKKGKAYLEAVLETSQAVNEKQTFYAALPDKTKGIVREQYNVPGKVPGEGTGAEKIGNINSNTALEQFHATLGVQATDNHTSLPGSDYFAPGKDMGNILSYYQINTIKEKLQRATQK